MSFEQNRHVEGTPSNLPALVYRARRAILCLAVLLPALFAWGCSGIVSGNSTAPQSTPQTFSISGTVTPATGGNGATITVSGAANATATANSSGNFTVSGLVNGTYTITPSHAGYTFSPTVQTATVNGANVTGLNFTAQSNPTFSISGTISPITGGSGSTVTLSGAAAATMVADGAGNYIFNGLGNGSYTIAPANTGYTFTPATQSVAINGASVSGVNFAANAVVTHTVALTWIASATSTVTGYNVYRSTLSGTGYSKVNPSLVLAPLVSYSDATVLNSTTYFYVTTAVDASGAESIFSNEVTASIP